MTLVERKGELKLMTTPWDEIVSGSGLLLVTTRSFVVLGTRLSTVVDDEMLSVGKRKPSVLGDGSSWVDGEEIGPGGVVDWGDDRSGEELLLSNGGLLEPEGGVALLLPSGGEGESVEGEELSPVEFGLDGICTGEGEG